MLPSAHSFATLSPLAGHDGTLCRTSASSSLPEHLEQLAAAWALPLFYQQQYALQTRLLPYLQLARAKKVSFIHCQSFRNCIESLIYIQVCIIEIVSIILSHPVGYIPNEHIVPLWSWTVVPHKR